jgi:hypothetical protein
MVRRLLNAGVREAGGIQLAALVRKVAERQDVDPKVRRAAEAILVKYALGADGSPGML